MSDDASATIDPDADFVTLGIDPDDLQATGQDGLDPFAQPIVRDCDIYDDITKRLSVPKLFDRVLWADSPDENGAAYTTLAIVKPGSGEETEGTDDPDETVWQRTVSWSLEIRARNADPRKRDRLAERLLSQVRNALDYQSLAGATFPAMTKLTKDQFGTATPPERILSASGQFTYYVSMHDTDA